MEVNLKKKNTGLIAGIAAVVVVLAVILMVVFSGGGKNSLQSQLDLGQKYMQEGNYEQAVAAYLAAIEIDDRCTDAYIGAARAYEAMGDVDSAVSILTAGLEKTGDSELETILEEIVFASGVYIIDLENQSDREMAEQLYQYILQNPDDARGYAEFAEFYLGMGELEAAKDVANTGYDRTGDVLLEEIIGWIEDAEGETSGEDETNNDVETTLEGDTADIIANNANADVNSRLEEFLYAPEKVDTAFTDMYKTAGAESYASGLGIAPNEDALNINGVYMAYNNEPRYYVDGTVEEGADLYCRDDKLIDDLFYSYTNFKYNETDLQEVKTHILDIDNMSPQDIPRVCGFSNFLYNYQCNTTAEVVAVLGLGNDVLAAVNAREEYYTTEIVTEKFGTVKIEVDSSVAMVGDLYSKTVYLTFEEGSISPYQMVIIAEGWPANYMGEIKSLQVTGYTKYDD